LPNVSICTPTFNRRPFFPYLIKIYKDQTYPKDKIEWIIIDDGSDKIKDLVENIEGVKYFSYNKKMTIGKKRNLLNEKSTGDIIIYMDDDDYYPPTRVEHAVNELMKDKSKIIAASSEMYIYFNKIKKLYKFGPYNKNHGTAATFAFKKELLKITKFNDNASLSEEKEFLKNYTIPMIQLDPIKTILVFSHLHNTFDKNELLLNKNELVKESNISLKTFIKNKELYDFYINNLNNIVDNYELGSILYKPDVIIQKKQIEEQRDLNLSDKNKFITLKVGEEVKHLSKDEVIKILQSQHDTIINQSKIIDGKNQEIALLKKNIKKKLG
jgi:glycosyltransferase involved in cell wall biosynthesis